jgi:hypothetical protein
MADNEYKPEAWEEALNDYYDKARAEAEAFFAKWPNACKKCGGWGAHVFYESHGLPGIAEQLSDPCDDCTANDPVKCARCGAENTLSPDGDGPCKACGWNYDDGAPEV